MDLLKIEANFMLTWKKEGMELTWWYDQNENYLERFISEDEAETGVINIT